MNGVVTAFGTCSQGFVRITAGDGADGRARGGADDPPGAGGGRDGRPSGAQTCTSHSKVQFQPSFSSAKRTAREQNAHLDERGTGDRVPGIGVAGPAPEHLR